MMNKLSRILKLIIIGFGFGSFFFLSVVLIQENSYLVKREDFLVVLVCSALYGLYTLIFESDRLSFLVAICIHFIVNFITATFMLNAIQNASVWSVFWEFFTVFVIIYILVWVILELFTIREVKLVNEKLKK